MALPQLEALAAEAPRPAETAPRVRSKGQPFDVDAFLARAGIVATKSPWKDGTRWVLGRCPMSDAHTDGAYIVQFASGAIDAGCQHTSCTWGWRELREKVEPTGAAPRPAAAADHSGSRRKRSAGAPQVLGPITLRLSEVTAKPIAWLWRGRLALGELTIMIGDPGEGKGLISTDLAGKITRGDPLPGDLERPEEPATVVVLSGEDNPETVIRPRYEAAGAALERVILVPGKIVLRQPKNGDESGEEFRPLGEAGMPPDEVEAAAKDARISTRTLERAKKKAGVISRRRKKDEDGNGDWVWTSWTHCWSCHCELCVEDHNRGPVCHWLRCRCGKCQEGCDGEQAECEPAQAGRRSLRVPTNGRGRREDRQPPDKTANSPASLAVLPNTVDGQGVATPPTNSMNGGLENTGAPAPVPMPLHVAPQQDEASPMTGGTNRHADQDRQPDFNTAIHEEPWRSCPLLEAKASDQDRQVGGGNGGVGGEGAVAADASPATASPPTDDGEDLDEVTI